MSLKIGLALSGGGGSGFAHLGVIEVLLKNGINIDFVSGTSMGSIIGGMFADNKDLNSLFEFIESFKKTDVIDFNLFKLLKNGLIAGNKLEKYLNEKLVHKNIEDFKIPYTAITVDILSGKQVVLSSGSGAFAMRASSAIPGVFSSCPYEDKILVDGGIVNNLPQDVVKQMGADYIIAVDCLGDYACQMAPKNVIESVLSMSNLMLNKSMYSKKKYYNTLIKVNTIKDAKITTPMNLNKDSIEECIEMGRVAAKKKINKILKDIKKLEG